MGIESLRQRARSLWSDRRASDPEATKRFRAGPRNARARHSLRWLLWGALVLLVLMLIGVLVFLADNYERGRDQAALDRAATGVAGDIKNALVRNVQTLQSLNSSVVSAGTWSDTAANLLNEHREIVHLEWRNRDQNLIAAVSSPFLADLFSTLGRDQSLADVGQACDNARRLSGPAFAPSYFWPLSGGKGLELMEMCQPVTLAGQPNGFLIATYSLPGILAELTDKNLLRGRGLAFVDPDGTRLALHSQIDNTRRSLRARAVVDVPGQVLTLQLDGPRLAGGWYPNLMTGVVSALALALLGVLLLLGRDIRLRLATEHELGDALAFRKAMENSLVTGLRARDMAGHLTYVNPALCQMLGYSAEELLGSGLPAPYWPPDMAVEYLERQQQRLAGQELPREGFESVFQRKDGSRLPVLIIEAPLIDAQGEQTGWMGAILDMSEQRRVEEINRASQERLQATARLATVGEMASLMSHELNQPLAAIASYASGTLNLLQPGAGAMPVAELKQAMQRIAEQAERAGRVIKSVADFVRRRTQSREAVTAQELIASIMPLLGMQARKTDIRLVTRFEPDLPPVWCDRTMVEQVLLNLARNGMQAMPDGEPPAASGLRLLTLAVSRAGQPAGREARKQWVEFAVTDHGLGLEAEVQEKLFTPFFTTRAEGMGLGLSLCRTVIEQHGGALTFGPAIPRGTVFRFTLPAAPAAPATPT